MNFMNLIYPKLSYKIIGIALKVFNDLGYTSENIFKEQ